MGTSVRLPCHCERSEAISGFNEGGPGENGGRYTSNMTAPKTCAIYIMSNARNTVLYTGVTSDLRIRVVEHRLESDPTVFTRRYNICKLVYYETTPNIAAAIAREKQIKAGSRAKKVALIEAMNPEWRDLAEDW